MGKRTKLFNIHLSSGGSMVDFSGWEMPLHYGSQIEEHKIVRQDSGMFDVSHMGVVDLTGIEAKKFLSYLLSNDINKLSNLGTAMYSCMLNNKGGIIDDLIVYYIGNNKYRLIVNAATKEKDLNWIKSVADSNSFKELHIVCKEDLSIIAVQGPKAIQKVCDSLIIINKDNHADCIKRLKKFECIEIDNCFYARTGYTGEDGLEIILPNSLVVEYWKNLSKQDIAPIGLGARDTLRLEAGFNLYGTDMNEDNTPLESNLAWTVNLNTDRKFVGKKSLIKQKELGINKKLIAILLEDKGILRSNYLLEKSNNIKEDNNIGIVTSGGYSPILEKSIAFARVSTPVETEYLVSIRKRKLKAKVVKLPFVTKK